MGHRIFFISAFLLLQCPDLSFQQFPYSDGMGAGYHGFAQSIGSKTPVQCVAQNSPAILQQVYDVDCSDLVFGGICRATIDLYEAYQNSIVGITFKSLNGVQNFTKNYPDYFAKDTLVPFEKWGMVSRDLQIAFERIWSSGFTNYMQEMWGKYCDLVLSFSGINFGSCLAQMTAVKFIQDKWWPTTQVFFVGFATPRCGSEDFAYYVDLSLGKNAYRVNWKADPIPQLPATTCTRGGSAQLGRCTNSWYHCCTQYTYTKWVTSGGYLVSRKVQTCTDPEDTKCLTGSTPADFYGYFGSVPNDYDNMSC